MLQTLQMLQTPQASNDPPQCPINATNAVTTTNVRPQCSINATNAVNTESVQPQRP